MTELAHQHMTVVIEKYINDTHFYYPPKDLCDIVDYYVDIKQSFISFMEDGEDFAAFVSAIYHLDALIGRLKATLYKHGLNSFYVEILAQSFYLRGAAALLLASQESDMQIEWLQDARREFKKAFKCNCPDELNMQNNLLFYTIKLQNYYADKQQLESVLQSYNLKQKKINKQFLQHNPILHHTSFRVGLLENQFFKKIKAVSAKEIAVSAKEINVKLFLRGKELMLHALISNIDYEDTSSNTHPLM